MYILHLRFQLAEELWDTHLGEAERRAFRQRFVGQAEGHVLQVAQHDVWGVEVPSLLGQVGDDGPVGVRRDLQDTHQKSLKTPAVIYWEFEA